MDDFDVDGRPRYGTHQQRHRPAEGWPNTKAPEKRAGRRTRKARERLARRIKDYLATYSTTDREKGAVHQPGSQKR